MARFFRRPTNRIKSDVSLVRLVEQSGVTLKPHGKDRIGHCPFMRIEPVFRRQSCFEPLALSGGL